jgi:hypothetical protein
MFIVETYPFSRKLPGKRKFSRNEISRKFAHFRIIFAFRENGKNRVNPIHKLQPMFNGWNIYEKSKNFFVKTYRYTIFKYLFMLCTTSSEW